MYITRLYLIVIETASRSISFRYRREILSGDRTLAFSGSQALKVPTVNDLLLAKPLEFRHKNVKLYARRSSCSF